MRYLQWRKYLGTICQEIFTIITIVRINTQINIHQNVLFKFWLAPATTKQSSEPGVSLLPPLLLLSLSGDQLRTLQRAKHPLDGPNRALGTQRALQQRALQQRPDVVVILSFLPVLNRGQEGGPLCGVLLFGCSHTFEGATWREALTERPVNGHHCLSDTIGDGSQESWGFPSQQFLHTREKDDIVLGWVTRVMVN